MFYKEFFTTRCVLNDFKETGLKPVSTGMQVVENEGCIFSLTASPVKEKLIFTQRSLWLCGEHVLKGIFTTRCALFLTVESVESVWTVETAWLIALCGEYACIVLRVMQVGETARLIFFRPIPILFFLSRQMYQ